MKKKRRERGLDEKKSQIYSWNAKVYVFQDHNIM